MDSSPQVDPPLGVFASKVDDKGRLKLPSNFMQYLDGLGAKEVFATTRDKATCQLYTRNALFATRKKIDDGPDKAVARALKQIMDHWGQMSDVDSHGRVLLPTDMRRALSLENATVRLKADAGVITVYGEEAYSRSLESAEALVAARADYVDGLGLI